MNIASVLPEMARRHPDKIAIHQQGGSITYRELDEDSGRIARGLLASGIARGMRTVMMVPPGRDFFALAFGMARAGVVPVVVDPGMGLANLKQCLREAEPEAFVGVTKAHLARMMFGWARDTIRIKTTVGKLRRRATPGAVMVDAEPDEVAAILFTSGSTGCPKGVVYTHGNFAAQIEMLRRMASFGEREIDLATFPPFALFDPALGMTTVVPEMDFTRPASANPRKIVDAIQRHGCTNMFCSPALLGVLARWGVANGVKLPSLLRVVSAGAPVSPKIVEMFSSMLSPEARVITPYGATEALPVAAIDSAEILQMRQRTQSGAGVCVGRVVDGVEVAIVPISDDVVERIERIDGVGEICVRGAVVTRSYYNRSHETALAKIGEWHRMGDVGYFDEHGRLWFCGRKSQRVGQLHSIPVEAIFDTHPRVRRTALVRVQEKPVLCVELEQGASKREVERELLAIGARHAHTADLKTILFHRRFPVDPRHNAKIGREKLGAWAEERLR